jgi:hypothetical protein
MKKVATALSLTLSSIPFFSMAHPGHGASDGYTIIHYMKEPVHIFVSAFVLVLVVIVKQKLDRRKKLQENN